MAAAIRAAVEMPAEERRIRMTRMHQLIREQNVYRWAGLLLSELSAIHHDRLPEGVSPAVRR
jgi:trehalose-6-phosphate synthase